ncbi:hypothetical protein SAMN05444392_101812 [Seinonella peptonophila]|uniref:Membrane domain of glycerophosphoryl diester phosphodiesterase n=1 Tax=Seinonella peptonophila TaxID=112248 RepID=A0A1M4U4S3_9BACL|nr:hypothetical protein [Seinonella peptonophila]SHE51749.1 hypothetical protein SAMN05444392_101812 [Seinonella peptonophila]
MDSFISYFRRFGLKLGITNLAGIAATTLLMFTISFVTILFFFFTFIVKLISQLKPLFSPSALQNPGVDQFNALANIEATLNQSTGIWIGMIIAIFAILIISIFCYSFNMAGSVASVNEIFQSNQSKFKTYFKQGFRYLLRTFGLMIVLFILYLPALLISAAVFYLLFNTLDPSTGTASSLFWASLFRGLVGFAVLLILSFFTFLALMHAPLILIAENIGVFRSISLSIQLLFQSFQKVFVSSILVFLIGIAIFCISFAFQLPNLLTIFDPIITGFLLIFYNLFNDLILAPILSTIAIIFTTMIISYRYYKYLRLRIFPNSEPPSGYHPNYSFSSEEPKKEED